jgi:hypothetical protein
MEPNRQRMVRAIIPLRRFLEHHEGKHFCRVKSLPSSLRKCGLEKSQCRGGFMARILEASHAEKKGVVVFVA